MSTTTDPRTVPELLSDLARELTTLFRKEGQLIRSELSDKVTRIEIGAGSLIAGGILLLAALLVLLQALVIGLTNLGLGAGWASLLVGVVVAAIGVFLLRKGASDMSPSNLTPDRATRQIKKDAELAREQVR